MAHFIGSNSNGHTTAECFRVKQKLKKERYQANYGDKKKPYRKEHVLISTLVTSEIDEGITIILDTGSSRHFVGTISLLARPEEQNPPIVLATAHKKGPIISLIAKGALQLPLENSNLTLQDVYYSPDVCGNLIVLSMGLIQKKGASFTFHSDLTWTAKIRNEVILEGTLDLETNQYCVKLLKKQREQFSMLLTSEKLANKDMSLYLPCDSASSVEEHVIDSFMNSISEDLLALQTKNQTPNTSTDIATTPLLALQTSNRDQSSKTDKLNLTLFELHQILGHFNQITILQCYKKGLFPMISLTDQNIHHCEPCVLGKFKKISYPKYSSEKSFLPGEMLHLDTNFSNVTSAKGNNSCLVVVDDATRFRWVNVQHSMKHPQEYLSDLLPMLQNLTKNTLLVVQKDNGTEFLGTLQYHFKKYGVEIRNSIPKDDSLKSKSNLSSAAQNGLVERSHQTLWNMARASLLAAKLPLEMWDDAMNYSCYMLNRIPQQYHLSRNLPSPFELLYARKPTKLKLIQFGCLAYVKIIPDTRASPLGIPAVFVGYSDNMKAYKVYDPVKNSYVDSRDVYFVPSKMFFVFHQ